MNPRAAQQRVELVERDAEATCGAWRSPEQPRDRIALVGAGGVERDRTCECLATLHPAPHAINDPRERRVAQQPVQSLGIDVSHSCEPSGAGAALTRGDSGGGSTRTFIAPSHSQRVTSTAATPSIRDSCAIASPGTSA